MPFKLTRIVLASPTFQLVIRRQFGIAAYVAGFANYYDDLSVLSNLGSRYLNAGIARAPDCACQVALTKCSRATRHVSQTQRYFSHAYRPQQSDPPAKRSEVRRSLRYLLHFNRILCLFHPGRVANTVVAVTGFHGCESVFVSPQARDSGIPLAFDLHKYLIK